MAVRPIVLYPDPVLLRPTRPVEKVDDSIRELVDDMRDTMYAAMGIGLAANQIGVPLRLFVIDITAGEEEGHFHAFINPQVVEIDGKDRAEEGCLSFPEIMVDVTRAERATIEAVDLEGNPVRQSGEGLFARAMLHECEHLDGQTFLRHLSSLKRSLVKKRIQKRIHNGDWVSAVER